MFVGRVDAPLTVVRPSQIRTCGFSASGSVRNELFTLSFIYSDIDPRSYQRIAVIQRFQSFLKSGLLPCAAHRSLPVHDLFPERNLIPDIVIYEPPYSFRPNCAATLPVPFLWPLQLSRQLCFSLLDYSPCNARRSDPAGSPPADNTLVPFSSNTLPASLSVFL